jgi:hypothetical protein
MGRRPLYLLILTFFGLTYNIIPKFRVSLFTQIHEIIFHGNGGYDYETIYNMPIWLRKFTFNKLKEWYDKSKPQDKGGDALIKDQTIRNAGKQYQSFQPTYTTTKASKK